MYFFMLFLKEKQAKALIVLKDKPLHLSKIAREIGATYIYITKLMNILEKKELVVINEKGKKRIVSLTEKGKEVANLLENLFNLI